MINIDAVTDFYWTNRAHSRGTRTLFCYQGSFLQLFDAYEGCQKLIRFDGRLWSVHDKEGTSTLIEFPLTFESTADHITYIAGEFIESSSAY